jgi:hypothetical protein
MSNLEPDYKVLVDKQCLRMVEYIANSLNKGSISDLLDNHLGKLYDIYSSFLKPHLSILYDEQYGTNSIRS